MKKQLNIFAMLVFALVVSPCVLAQNSNSKAEQEVLKASDEVIAALLNKDFTVLEHAYTTDCILTTSSGAAIPQTRWLASFKTGQARYDAWEKEERKVFLYGSTAVINARFKMTSHNSAGKSFTEDLRCTTTWVKQKGKWLIAASQFTAIKPPAPPTQ